MPCRTLWLVACVFFPLASYAINQQNDLSLSIEGLSHCEENSSNSIHLNSRKPVTLLVHGCNASAANFTHLSEVLAFQDQQAICFSYNDRASLMLTAERLDQALSELSQVLPTPDITVIAHSQGGLIARKALSNQINHSSPESLQLNLVTVSAPLSGIKAAKYCGVPWIRMATLGIHDLLCWAISGDKWHEITDASDYIQQPGELAKHVNKYLLIATDEVNSCRRYDAAGACVEDDYVFSLSEQVLPKMDNGSAEFATVEINAGHVEIVGKQGVPPYKLIKTLQQSGYIKEVSVEQKDAFQALLSHLY